MSAGVIHPTRRCRTLAVSLGSLSLSVLPLVANPNGELVSGDSARKTCLVQRAGNLGASPVLWQKQPHVSYKVLGL